jgi:hypothetical protein
MAPQMGAQKDLEKKMGGYLLRIGLCSRVVLCVHFSCGWMMLF